MKMLSKKIAVLLIVTLSAGLLGGCGQQFDAAAYVKALLDNSYKNDSKAFVEQKLGTAEEAVEIHGIVSIKIIHYRHGIPFHTVAFEQMYASHHLLPRWRAPLHPSKFIVKLLGPVNADAHEPMVSSEESAPIVVQQRAVRLNAVVDDVFACILFL